MKVTTYIGLLLWMIFLPILVKAQSSTPWCHRYDQTLVMKMFLSKPDGKGGSDVRLKFEDVMELVKYTDQLTLQVPKVIYLVGWQYSGHDDKYPAFFEVNENLKRPVDKTALASLRWLIQEAKKYNTTVSLHINMTDAYQDSPLWDTYVANDLLSKSINGDLKVIGNYNGKKAYHINYKREWESGWARKRIDSLLAMIPELKLAGTIHLDAWIARSSEGHNEGKEVDMEFQMKVADYWLANGIDPTTEWVMDYMLGRVPYYWHFNGHTQTDYLKYPASLVTGSHFNPDLKKSDFGLEFLFGTSMYGETIFPKAAADIEAEDWVQDFCRDFYLDFLQYHYLNQLKRLKVTGADDNRIAYYAQGVAVSLADRTVQKDGQELRKGNTVFFPVGWTEDKQWLAYSEGGGTLVKSTPDDWGDVKKAGLYLVTKNGLVQDKQVPILRQRLTLTLLPSVPYIIKPVY